MAVSVRGGWSCGNAILPDGPAPVYRSHLNRSFQGNHGNYRFTKDDLIYAYSRKQAIADGVLIDVTNTAHEAGFVVPVAVTSTAWAECVAVAGVADLRSGTPRLGVRLFGRGTIEFAPVPRPLPVDLMRFGQPGG
jgi:hypothetical protein